MTRKKYPPPAREVHGLSVRKVAARRPQVSRSPQVAGAARGDAATATSTTRDAPAWAAQASTATVVCTREYVFLGLKGNCFGFKKMQRRSGFKTGQYELLGLRYAFLGLGI